MNKKLTPIASAVALLLMGASFSTQAQQATTTTAQPAPAKDANVETVVVTGIRASLQQSLTQKRNSSDHVDVVTSEDIGKMPDKNVADSLERLPGVTISSAGGTEGGFDEADRVSMRGTNPSLTQTLINGHSVASGDWFVLDQSGTVGRSVSYTLFPSEVVGSVVVHKSSEASLVEGGVAGTVDILTRKPLDFKNQFTAEATIGAEYSDLPGTTDPQFNALINWKNDAKTFGLLIGAFDEQRHLERQGQELLDWNTITPGSAVAKTNPNLIGVQLPGLIGSTLFDQERKRTGGEFDAQFKINNDVSFDVNGFSSLLQAPNYNRNYMMYLNNFIGTGGGTAPNPGYQVTNGVLTNATWTGVAGTNYGIYDQIDRPNESETSRYIAIDGKWRVNSDLKFTGQLGASSGDGKTPTQNVMETVWGNGAGASYAMNGMGSAVTWNVGNNANAGSPSTDGTAFGWLFGDQNIDVKDVENWYQVDGEWDASAGNFTTVQFGLRFNNHERSLGDVIGQGPEAAQENNVMLGSYQNYPSGFGSSLGGSYPTNVWYYTPSQLAAYDAGNNRAADGSREDFDQEFDVHEKDSAFYVQGNLEGSNWNGNVGVRFVKTDESSAYNQAEPATPAGGTNLPGEMTASAFGDFLPTTVLHTYTNALPSLNLKVDLTKDLVARFAVSKTLSRPDYTALAGVVTPGAPPQIIGGVVQGYGGGSGGNPNLQPIISNNVDATLEWYFAPHALFSAALFEMDMTSYVGYGTTMEYIQSPGGTGIPAGTVLPYAIAAPVNMGALVKGTELSYQQNIGNNFGVITNYTYINAADQFGNPVVGASKNTGNLTFWYEDNSFNARIAYNFRSAFYSGLDRSTAFFQDSTATLAATLGYKYNDHLAFSLDGMNLNNPVLKYYGSAGETQPERFYVNGRQYYLNAHLKF